MRAVPARLALHVCAFASAALASAQQFTRNTTTVPLDAGNFCENVDFADIDLDGDWDAAFANGGDGAQLQDVIWINQGFAQGGTLGAFADATAARAPVILDQSRDIEFVDFDADGDVDVYVSNTAQLVSQGNRWWTNMGGLQGGSAGFYQDETAARFVGLGLAGSSIPPSLVLPAGNFADFSNDSDFADLDDDGDLDLVHGSVGPAVAGSSPSRIFLNDGLGHFEELNPSGFQLSGSSIVNTNPGLWCEGTQAANTADASGTNCDIATSAIGLELADVDGDLDFDILLGARTEAPRLFENRLAQSGRFRDVTSSAFPPGYATGQGHYEQALGDLDGDFDLDLYGVNWVAGLSALTDATFAGSGAGTFAAPVLVTGTGSDDDEVDFIDVDLDGDIDVHVTSYGANDRVHLNNGVGVLTLGTGFLPNSATFKRDTDVCDFDGDGDYDLITTLDGTNQQERVLVNGGAAVDSTAPNIVLLTQAPDRVSGPAPTVVRVAVYDNASHYTTWYDAVSLEVVVNGGPPAAFPMRSSGGQQIFRGEIPGVLTGTISYRVFATDEHGNQSVSGAHTFQADGMRPFCTNGSLGIDHTTACPCGNAGAAGNGCGHSFDANGANLSATGAAATDTVVLVSQFGPSTAFTLFLQHSAQGDGVFHDGVLCAGGVLTRLRGRTASFGTASFPNSLFANDATTTLSQRGGVVPGSGVRRFYSAWFRNASTTFCPPATANVSNGWLIDW